ncbi:MAG: hypothetical protein KGH63_00975 [Candidatus Micrarchaeota archaeon]|nr:hypothetical protein [Candidatus Micrarchaeota archaeon]
MAPKLNRPTAVLWPALLVAVVALAWLGQEMNWLATGLPLGPLGMLLIALTLAVYAYPD